MWAILNDPSQWSVKTKPLKRWCRSSTSLVKHLFKKQSARYRDMPALGSQVPQVALRHTPDVLVRLGPLAVEVSGAVRALVAVAAKEVALRLREVGRQARPAVRVKIVERGGKARHRDAARDREGDDAPPGRLALVQVGREGRVDHQIRQLRIGREGGADAIQEASAYDAAAPPDAGALGKVDAPVHLVRCRPDEGHALGIAADLRRVQRILHIRDDLLLRDGRHL
eukprot:scaffold1867_cov247-Pinguiococcus_pyrenoidosus.AAC.14